MIGALLVVWISHVATRASAPRTSVSIMTTLADVFQSLEILVCWQMNPVIEGQRSLSTVEHSASFRSNRVFTSAICRVQSNLKARPSEFALVQFWLGPREWTPSG